MLPAIPGQESEDDATPGAHDLGGHAHEGVEKRPAPQDGHFENFLRSLISDHACSGSSAMPHVIRDATKCAQDVNGGECICSNSRADRATKAEVTA